MVFRVLHETNTHESASVALLKLRGNSARYKWILIYILFVGVFLQLRYELCCVLEFTAISDVGFTCKANYHPRSVRNHHVAVLFLFWTLIYTKRSYLQYRSERSLLHEAERS